MSLAPMEELFRHRVFKMFMKKGLLNAERVKLMESWEHSGFNIDASVRIGADDATGRENLARYLIRVPFSAKKIAYNVAESTVICVMKIVSFIEDPRVIRAILTHLALWDVPRARPPPVAADGPVDFEYVPCADWMTYEDSRGTTSRRLARCPLRNLHGASSFVAS